MRKEMKRFLGVAAVVALTGLAMASVASATDRLTVKDSTATNNVFRVDDSGKIWGMGGIQTTDTTGTVPLFFVHPTSGRIAVGNNTPNAAIWLTGNVANNIQVVSLYTGTTTAGGGGGFVLGHNNASNAYANAGDRLGYLLFASTAANGTTMRNGGGISGWAEATFTDTSAPTYFKFETASTSTTSTARSERLRISANGNIVTGNLGGAATGPLATTATDGFLYIPTVAGTVTCSSVTAYNGHVPVWFNTSANQICTCNGSTVVCK